MTANRPRASSVRWTVRATGSVAAAVLTVGCATEAPADRTGTEDGTTGTGSAAAGPVVDGACPAGLTAGDLTHSTRYAAADVDGDGRADEISVGMVGDGGPGCSAALVVTTAAGTAAAALPRLQVVPSRAFVPGGAATVGGEPVLAAPVSYSPRGGGEVGLFRMVRGVLTPVRDDSGDVWTIVSTVDDGGGTHQSIDCVAGGLTHVEATGDAMSAPDAHEVRYRLEGVRLIRTGTSRVGQDASAPDTGLEIFASC